MLITPTLDDAICWNAALDKSKIFPFTKGPLSLILTTTDLLLAILVTFNN